MDTKSDAPKRTADEDVTWETLHECVRSTPAPRRHVAPPSPVPVFVLGLVGVLGCPPIGIAAWILSERYLRRCCARGVPPQRLGLVGRALGIAATILALLLGVIVGVALIVRYGRR